MSSEAKTLITLATYNEIENLPRLVDEILSAVPHVDVLVIDDNSPDGTGCWCDEFATSEPRLHCLHRSGKLGLGTATIAGMRYAIDNGYELVLNMDADFSHHPRYLGALLALMNAAEGAQPVDVAIGSRYIDGGAIEGWPLKRHFMSRSINLASRWLLGLKARDCSGAFRCYRTAAMSKIDFTTIRSRGYSFQEEILWRLKKGGARVAESPIVFLDRQRGSSKIDRREAFAALRILVALGAENWLGSWSRKPKRRPLAGDLAIGTTTRRPVAPG